ncbi:class I SAM-dependent methyltransferase [Oleiagrimonas sp. MCCC 1A03011]|uniref:class I SAM-dependent methyltransferase n=1 Tax=Oleiagrimonas sp. MCCC 1A03011 TaxID=1926883 RepID=UPI000DC261DA|nr:class I SAM-dependent methyltransferase [Oleiagrimonas sp. MCCC 1A03011]RAP57298.1 SAM-dependent methyltransferase [Oleiagrimonas sp. MCCC 1A03011]
MNKDADRILDLYQRHAAAWQSDRLRTHFDERSWMDRFLEMVPASGEVLDLGCGCGEPVAAYLVEQGRAVTGVDGAAMVALSRARLPTQTWVQADMRGLDLARRFDGVLAWNSFFHLAHEDQRAMFAVFARHAAPGAPLMFTSGTEHGVAMGTFRGEPLYHASLDTEAYRALLHEHGFEVVDHCPEDTSCGGLTIWLARRLDALET